MSPAGAATRCPSRGPAIPGYLSPIRALRRGWGQAVYMGGASLARRTAVLAGAATPGSAARSGPGRKSMPQITAPAAKMPAATQNPVV